MDLKALVGRTLGGKYRLEATIASGGYGAVFRAAQLPLNRPVALKVNLHGQQPAMRARFKREAEVLTRLRHPGIVQLLDYGEEMHPDFGPLFYMVQELVPGESLKALLARTPKLTPDDAAGIVGQVLVALGEAHRSGIVHRDIKPGNLMLAVEASGERAIRVLDFGISKAAQSGDDLGTLTATGAFMGTPAYMAPEQCQHQPVSPATDLYAVGILLYRMLAGELPFRASNLWGYLSQHIEARVPPLPSDVPACFTPIIERALAKDAADRYGSADEMREAIRRAAPGAESGFRSLPSGSPPPLSGGLPSGVGPVSPDAGAAPLGHPADAVFTAPYGSEASSLPTLDPDFGETTTAGPMVIERLAEHRPRWWMAVIALAAIGLVGGLSAIRVDEAADTGIPSRIVLSTTAPATSPVRAFDASSALGALTADASVADEGIGDIATPDKAVLAEPVKAAARRARRRGGRASPPKKPAVSPPQPTPVSRPQPPPASLPQLTSAFDRELGRCDCSQARSRLDAMRQLDPPTAAVKTRRYEEECQMRLPGNCRSR